MIRHKDHFHGSDLEKIEQVYGIKKEEITSFSANVNPLGISPALRQTLSEKIDAITTYPDRDYVSLRKCIADYVGTDFEHIIVGNGSTELISLFIQIEHPKKAVVIGPSYSEYEREIALGGGTTLYYPLREEDGFLLDTSDFISKLKDNIDLLILCNPNNPTSTSITKKSMRLILDACMQHGIYVMVDETYVEFADNMEQITSVPLTNYYNNLVIFRNCTCYKAFMSFMQISHSWHKPYRKPLFSPSANLFPYFFNSYCNIHICSILYVLNRTFINLKNSSQLTRQANYLN